MTWLGIRAGAANLLVPSDEVVEVLPLAGLTAVPLTQAQFRGLCNVRGTLYSVLDLPALLGFATVPAGSEARLLLLPPARMRHTAVLVDRLLGLFPTLPGGHEPAAGSSTADACSSLASRWPGLLGTARDDAHGATWRTLDVAHLVALPGFLDIAAQPGPALPGVAA